MTTSDQLRKLKGKEKEELLAEMLAKNNPLNEPVGHWSGRCKHCGSKDLWDDNIAYGCNDCGAFLASN